MAQPTLRQLRTFLAVVEAGNISTAARSLNLTQPAASQQLRELARVLRVRLLERAAGKIQPTAAGVALLEPARRAQAAIDDAVAAVATHRSGDNGRVRVGTGATACIYLLPPILSAVKRQMPGLEVVIATGNSADMARQVETGELDVALVTLPIARSRALSVTRLLTDPLIALLPVALARDAPSLSAAQIARLPLILYEAGGTTRTIIDAWFRAAGVMPSPIMQLGSIETIKVLVSGGLGASIMPAMALATQLPGTVTRRLRPTIERGLGIVLRREKVLDRGLRVVLDALSALGTG
ncbi:MAG TPA: LysR family transcriptional regulator [Acetobacteraceae bacterium]|nr:LysR family transcriptional regulator [Acetobacteraceae bacterium]